MNEFVNFSQMYTNTYDNRSGARAKDFSNPNSQRAHLNKQDYKSHNFLAMSTQNLLGVMQGDDLDQTGQNLLSKSIDSNQLSKIIR